MFACISELLRACMSGCYHLSSIGRIFFLERWKLGNSCVQGAGGNGFVILAPGILKRF